MLKKCGLCFLGEDTNGSLPPQPTHQCHHPRRLAVALIAYRRWWSMMVSLHGLLIQPHWEVDFSPGKEFHEEIHLRYGTMVHHPSRFSNGPFFLLATFRWFLFHLTRITDRCSALVFGRLCSWFSRHFSEWLPNPFVSEFIICVVLSPLVAMFILISRAMASPTGIGKKGPGRLDKKNNEHMCYPKEPSRQFVLLLNCFRIFENLLRDLFSLAPFPWQSQQFHAPSRN